MSEWSKQLKDYSLIEAINLLVNSIERTIEDKKSLKETGEDWIRYDVLTFANQLEFIWGTAAANIECKYMTFCINKLNNYMMSDSKHKGLKRKLENDIINAINMAFRKNAHIWSRAKLDSIEAAFKSSRLAKARPFYEPKKLEEKKSTKIKYLEYKPDEV